MTSHVFGVHDDKTLEQFNDVASRAERAALMADGHLGYVMPIGGVAAYRNEVSPIGVGVDIGCGNAAIRTDLKAEALVDDLPELEGAWRVPAVVRWPGRIEAGSVSNEIMHHMDWLPTFLAVAGDPDIGDQLLTGYDSPALGRSYRVHLDGYPPLPHPLRQEI